jgi:hypothetical protein
VVGRPDHRLRRRSTDSNPTVTRARVFVEYFGFDVSQPRGEQAFREAEFGWEKMFERLPGVVWSLARRKGG